jgi:hypothetical protein
MAVPPTTRSHRRRRPIVVLLAVIAIALGASACMPPLVDPPTSGKNFGQGPLEAVYDAASAKAACGLSAIQLTAMMMSPPYTEAGGPVPSPMALSRWDNVSVSSSNANLFAFGQTTGSYVNAFFSPGIGMWQFDSAGGWPFSAAGAIDSVTAANQAATTISYRWCNAPLNQQTTEAQRRRYAWGPWFGCSTTNTCETIYQSLVAGGPDKLNTAFDATVTRYGGMQQRTCNVDGLGDGLTCWYVNPALAQGSKGWTGGTYNNTSTGVTPLPKPFYVVESGGREYRIWIRDDTGYDIGITASKPITSNARTSLTWTATAGLCDITAARGQCTGGANPVGSFDAATPNGPESIFVGGWAIDPDTAGSIQVHVYVDSVGTALVANLSRPDVAAAYPGYGDLHGFAANISAPAGPHQVCAYGINVQGGANVTLGCTSVTVTGRPSGSLDVATARPGAVDVAGWVAVPYAPGSPAILSVDGVVAAQIDPTIARSDVQALIPTAGTTTGFVGTVPASGGTHRICLSTTGAALDALGCRTVTLPSGPPFGSFDLATGVPGGVRVGGWAIDPDTATPIPVHVYVDSAGTALLADQSRPDVAAAFPGYGSPHGFGATVAATPGSHRVCAYGINSGIGANSLIGCKTVVVLAGNPFGSLDSVVRTSGGIRVAGWAVDPDTTDPTQVHVYVGPAGTALVADQTRPDVAGVLPGYGPLHGFVGTVPDPGGPVTVCAYAINVAGTGVNVGLGCRTL